MKTKICTKCGIAKGKQEFRKGRICKKCENENNKKWNELNKERMKEYQKKYYLENAEKMKERRKENWSNWYNKNKEHIKEYKKNKTELEKNKDKIRRTIRLSFRRKGFLKSKHTEEIVGITLDELYKYLLKTFKDNYSYEWDGVEKVHIDHIIPLSTANTEKEVMELCHYSNLQLLKAKDNLHKGSKLNFKLKGE